MRVRAADGLRVPIEHAPRTYIEAKSHEVENTLYYRRRIASGELIRIDAADTTEAKADTAPEVKADSKPTAKKRAKA